MDTRNKRASAIGIAAPWRVVFPNPDGSLASQEDRQQSAYAYVGVLAGSPVPFDPATLPLDSGAVVMRRGRPRQQSGLSYFAPDPAVNPSPWKPQSVSGRIDGQSIVGRPPNP